MELLLKNPEKINWDYLSINSSAIDLLKANPEKINWHWLSANTNPEAMDLLKSNQEKINWAWLSTNSSAIDILKANPEKIDWHSLSRNKNIFVNLNEMAVVIQSAFRKSKMYAEWSGHPDRLLKQGYFNEL
jgi:hypothetical protein